MERSNYDDSDGGSGSGDGGGGGMAFVFRFQRFFKIDFVFVYDLI